MGRCGNKSPRFFISIQKSPAEVVGETEATITMKPFIFKPPCKASLLGLLFLSASGSVLTSCKTAGQLNVSAVTYQSINTKKPQPSQDPAIPSDAKILVTYAINQQGQIGVIIKNLTDEIIAVDQEKSFFINTSGESHSYFDPTVYSTTNTNYTFGTTGTSVNLGSIASAMGVGGRLGTLLGGIGVSSSTTVGNSQSNTITVSDQKRVNIGPRGAIALSKTFSITGVGKNNVSPTSSMPKLSYKESPLRFSICITYAPNGEDDMEKLVTDFYVSASMYSPVESNGKVNAALRKIISQKPDLLAQPWYMINFNNNIGDVSGNNFWVEQINTHKTYDNILNGLIYDYQ